MSEEFFYRCMGGLLRGDGCREVWDGGDGIAYY